MSWQKVTVTCTLIIGAVISAALNNDALALVLAGGATGYMAQTSNGLIAKPKR